MFKNKKNSIFIVSVLTIILMLAVGSYAYWTWKSEEDKNIVFNTSKQLQDYIIYDEGESKFVGDFKISSTYLDGVHTTVSIYKTEEAKDIEMYATINMRINEIGENLKDFSGLKWTLTEGNSTSNGKVLASGNFIGYDINDTIELKTNIEVLTELKEYTVWLWLDSALNPSSELTGESVDTSIWTQVNQLKDERYEITSINYIENELNVSVINNGAKITHYQFTTENIEPNEWIAIADEEIDYTYTLKYSESLTDKNYIWFKDENGKVISSPMDNTPPSAPTTMNYVFGDWSPYTDNTWTNKIVYVASASEHPGPSGATDLESGIDKYQISRDNETWEDYNYVVNNYLEDELYSLASSGTHVRYFRACDKAGNCGPSISRIAKIDRTGPYGRVNLSLNNGVYTVSLADYGDDGSGLNTTYGFALISSGSCETATYTNQTALSKTYSGSYTAGATYYGCVKLTDNVGNISYLMSGKINYSGVSTYSSFGTYTYIVPQTGTYKIELWGASAPKNNNGGGALYGYTGGAYTSGEITLNHDEKLYFYLGQEGVWKGTSVTFNGGGRGYQGDYGSDYLQHYSGAGATDVRLINGSWNDSSSLRSRIMVAGGASYCSGGGGLSSDSTKSSQTTNTVSGATQTAGGVNNSDSTLNGSFGIGGNGENISSHYGSKGGGGGYYGGGGSLSPAWYDNADDIHNRSADPTGGSSYISGHTGCVAIISSSYTIPRIGTNGNSCTTGTSDNLCSIHYSGKSFTNTVMIDGNGYAWTNVKGSLQQMPNPNGGYYASGVGHSGDGVARISYNESTLVLTYNNNGGSGCHSKSITNGLTYGELCTPIREDYKFDGWYTQVSGGTQITESTAVSTTSNQTLYAHWISTIYPNISFGTNGNSSYVSGDISSTINVSRGKSDLDTSTYKYIWSTDKNDTPNTVFTSGSSYTLSNSTGTYYLIATACDIDGNCTKEVSNSFYVDNTSPTGSISANIGSNMVNATLTVSDTGSGVKNTYGWKISTSNVCDATTTGFTNSTNTSYNFTVSSIGTYYVCARVSDNVGNVSYIVSDKILNHMTLSASVPNGSTISKSHTATVTLSSLSGFSAGTYTIKYGTVSPFYGPPASSACDSLSNSTDVSISAGTKSKSLSFTFNTGTQASNGYFMVCTASDIKDINGNTLASGASAYDYMKLDNTKPTGIINSSVLNAYSSNVTISVQHGSPLFDIEYIAKYEYLVTTSSTCPTSGYISSTNSSYTWSGLTNNQIYNICVRMTDVAGNVGDIISKQYANFNWGSPISNSQYLNQSVPSGTSILNETVYAFSWDSTLWKTYSVSNTGLFDQFALDFKLSNGYYRVCYSSGASYTGFMDDSLTFYNPYSSNSSQYVLTSTLDCSYLGYVSSSNQLRVTVPSSSSNTKWYIQKSTSK